MCFREKRVLNPIPFCRGIALRGRSEPPSRAVAAVPKRRSFSIWRSKPSALGSRVSASCDAPSDAGQGGLAGGGVWPTSPPGLVSGLGMRAKVPLPAEVGVLCASPFPRSPLFPCCRLSPPQTLQERADVVPLLSPIQVWCLFAHTGVWGCSGQTGGGFFFFTLPAFFSCCVNSR